MATGHPGRPGHPVILDVDQAAQRTALGNASLHKMGEALYVPVLETLLKLCPVPMIFVLTVSFFIEYFIYMAVNVFCL